MSSWDKKLSSEPNDERRYLSAPIEQMRLLAAVLSSESNTVRQD